MSQPRRILSGTTYFITRRCSERRFLLRPDAIVEAVFLFCLAFASKLTGVEVHAYVVMSNHYHLVVTDMKGALPTFMAWLNRHSGHCLKIHRGREGDFWESSEKYSAIELTTEEAIWDKLAYLVANPAAANLVKSSSRWPGLVSLPAQALRSLNTKRPALYFRENGNVPANVKLTLTMPPALRERYDTDTYLETWKRLVRERESLARKERQGRQVLGVNAVRKTNPFARPRKTELRRKRNPALAAATREGLRIATKALRAFRASHQQVYRRLKLAGGGKKETLEFPPGTWWWVKYGGHAVAPA